VAQALAMLFTRAGVDFGILYDDERCDGNDIRRVGEEFLFLELAGHHVDSFTACDFEKIVCTDPHSYNTFANEYSEIDFGKYAADPVLSFEHDHHWNRDGGTEILHWTELIADLVESGRLDLSDADLDYTVTYHDPCHLGRYNDTYEPARRLIQATGAELAEMPRNRADAFCCGGGGGGVWLDVSDDPAPSVERLREATRDTTSPTGNSPEKFVVACPQCTSMFEYGRKTGGFEAAIDIVDLSELILEATEDFQPDASLASAADETNPSDQQSRPSRTDG
jgi:Fe-S oxidoreductase